MEESTVFTITEARQNLYGLVDQVNTSGEPVTLTGKRGNAILVGEEDWKSLQETLYLKSIPGMWDSIEAAMAAPDKDFSTELQW